MKLKYLVSIAAYALVAGCATAPVPGPAGDNIDITPYRAVTVAPVQFTPAALSALSTEERASLESDFRLALEEGMPPSLLTDAPSAGVVRIEVTVNELNASSPTVNLLTAALLFVPLDAGGIAFEARFYDGESREPFARTTHRHVSTPLELKGSFRRYGHATQALRKWAEEIANGPDDMLDSTTNHASARGGKSGGK